MRITYPVRQLSLYVDDDLMRRLGRPTPLSPHIRKLIVLKFNPRFRWESTITDNRHAEGRFSIFRLLPSRMSVLKHTAMDNALKSRIISLFMASRMRERGRQTGRRLSPVYAVLDKVFCVHNKFSFVRLVEKLAGQLSNE